MKITANINCDLGEGIANDAQIMPYIQLCNIACGGHHGDADSIRKTIELAQRYSVKVGAHPSFPDRENFGRKRLSMEPMQLRDSIIEQIFLFQKIAHEFNTHVHHIKLHGALYNLAAVDVSIAEIVMEALQKTKHQGKVYAPFRSVLERVAQPKYEVTREAFIDRTYQNDLSLTPRNSENALISNPEKAWKQMERILLHNQVETIQGVVVDLKAETFCIHGDTPTALETVKFIHEKLKHVSTTD